MYEYIEGKAMWANVSTPNTRFGDPKYQITVLTDTDTASKLEAQGLSQVRDRTGQPKYDEPAFSFSRKVQVGTRVNEAPKLVDAENNPLDVLVGNGSLVKVKIKPYQNNYGTFAELIAVNEEGEISYDVNNIKDEVKQGEARVIIQKVGTLEVITEALSFTIATHRANLEKLLNDSEEAKIIPEEAEEEDSKE